MKKRDERNGGNVFSFNYQSEFFCHKPLNHEESGTWDGRAVERAHAHKPCACCSVFCFLPGLLYLWPDSFKLMFFYSLVSFLLSLYSFSHGFGAVSVKVFVQCLASLFHVTLLYPTVWATIKHFRNQLRSYKNTKSHKITERASSPLTFTVRAMSLQTSERHFFFLLFLGCQRIRVTYSTKGIAEKE